MSARKQDRPLSARLAMLGEAVVSSNRRAREAELEARRVEADIARLKDAVLDAHADGEADRAAKASRERAQLEQTALREAQEKLEGSQRAAQRADVERAAFAAGSIDELIAERRSDALGAAQAVEDAVEQLGRAQASWNGVQAEVAGLLRLAGRPTDSLPRFPQQLADLTRQASRVGGQRVPPPIPGGHLLTPVTPTPEIPVNEPRLDSEQKPPAAREAA